MIYLLRRNLVHEAVTIILFLASAILVARVAGTAVDGGWDDDYTRSAIPVEIVFVITSVVVWWISRPGQSASAETE